MKAENLQHTGSFKGRGARRTRCSPAPNSGGHAGWSGGLLRRQPRHRGGLRRPGLRPPHRGLHAARRGVPTKVDAVRRLGAEVGSSPTTCWTPRGSLAGGPTSGLPPAAALRRPRRGSPARATIGRGNPGRRPGSRRWCWCRWAVGGPDQRRSQRGGGEGGVPEHPDGRRGGEPDGANAMSYALAHRHAHPAGTGCRSRVADGLAAPFAGRARPWPTSGRWSTTWWRCREDVDPPRLVGPGGRVKWW